mgnify:CR=1 FL=1
MIRHKRDSLHILNNILEVIRDGQGYGKTKIVSKSNISSEMFITYVNNILIKKGLVYIKVDNNSVEYYITDQGFRYLDDYDNFLKKFDLKTQ